MKKLLYIHGFGSSAQSGTVKLLRTKLYPINIQVVAQDVPLIPSQALPSICKFVEQEQPDLIVATSMGAMYAERLRGCKRLLVNPAFVMSESCKHFGFGKKEWLSKRSDGEKWYTVNKPLIDDFKKLEQSLWQGITEEDKQLVWAFFGTKDPVVNCQALYQEHYGTDHFYTFDGEHQLNDKVLTRFIIPKIVELI